MIEAVDIGPGAGIVAGFAAEGCAVGTFTRHTIVELALVGIRVTSGARAILEMERKNFIATASSTQFVTIRARDSNVSASKGKSRSFVFGD